MELDGKFGERVKSGYRTAIDVANRRAEAKRTDQETRARREEERRRANVLRSLPRIAVEELIKISKPEQIGASGSSWQMEFPLEPTYIDGEIVPLFLVISIVHSKRTKVDWLADPSKEEEINLSLVVGLGEFASMQQLPSLGKPTLVENDTPSSMSNRDVYGFHKFTPQSTMFEPEDAEVARTIIKEACKLAGIELEEPELEVPVEVVHT